MAAGKIIVALLTDYVRRNPKTSAMVAFNLGLYAAAATKRGIGKSDLTRLPSKLVELVPSMKDITSYVPLLSEPPKRRPARTRSRRRPVRRRAG